MYYSTEETINAPENQNQSYDAEKGNFRHKSI